MTPDEEYPKLEAIWISYPDIVSMRTKLEDFLLTYKKSDLEAIELYIWAHLHFGQFRHEKNEQGDIVTPARQRSRIQTAKAIRTIILEILGDEVPQDA